MALIDVQGNGDLHRDTRNKDGRSNDEDSDISPSEEDGEDEALWCESGEGQSLLKVLQAFQILKEGFDDKFKAMWA